MFICSGQQTEFLYIKTYILYSVICCMHNSIRCRSFSFRFPASPAIILCMQYKNKKQLAEKKEMTQECINKFHFYISNGKIKEVKYRTKTSSLGKDTKWQKIFKWNEHNNECKCVFVRAPRLANFIFVLFCFFLCLLFIHLLMPWICVNGKLLCICV